MASGLELARVRCTGCGDCCRELRVTLSFADLARLVRASGEPAEALVDWGSAEQVDISGEPSSLVLLPEGRRVLLLARRDGACRFLGDEDRCLVHAARPAVCRAYPLTASFGRKGGLARLRVLRGLDCPYELGESGDLGAVRRDHAALARELREHHALVGAWNRLQERRRRLGKRLGTARELFEWVELKSG